jgi:hypothetical protein
MGGSPPLQHWQTWYRICALAGCPDEVRAALTGFSHSRFMTYLRRLGGGDVEPGSAVEPARAWHLFESHLQLKATRQGKRYKDWLFARLDASADAPARVIEGGASLIVRSVVREYVRDERPRAGVASLDAPIADDFGQPLTLEDLLACPADTTDDVMARERDAMARRCAVASFAELADRDRIVLASKGLGVSLAHPVVERLAGSRKSVLSERYRGWVLQVADGLRSQHEGEDAHDLMWTALQTVHYARSLAVAWARSEKRCGDLFQCVER